MSSSAYGEFPSHYIRKGEMTKLNGPVPSDDPRQQDNVFRNYFLNIAKFGLFYEYKKLTGSATEQDKYKKTKSPKHVIVVGAGAAGLVTAFELAQAGHNVTILEANKHAGGRIKTVHSPITKTLHADVGAMRLPGTGVKGYQGPSHFITDFYIRHFVIKTREFKNQEENAFIRLYEDEKVTIKEWDENPTYYCDKYFSGWNENIPESEADINSINKLFERTIKPLFDDLGVKPSREKWVEWVKTWSKISVNQFLRSNDPPSPGGPQLRPWPEAAILGYEVAQYSPMMDWSLVEYLRESIGKWWMDPMYTPIDGMSTLPNAFLEKNYFGWNTDVQLENNIHYGIEVRRVEYENSDNDEPLDETVKVFGINTLTGSEVCYHGDAVIITVPLTILRQLDFKPSLPMETQKAIAGFSYYPSTKILLQFRKKFWRKDNIHGGRSVTNTPIGQIVYIDYPKSEEGDNSRGMILCYTFGQDALILGAQTETQAVATALAEVSKIHPVANELFEYGLKEGWFNEPRAQGAFAMLHPYEYLNSMHELIQPHHPIYLAGEAISWTNGWIQGALESGLRAAYQFFVHNELGELRRRVCDWPDTN